MNFESTDNLNYREEMCIFLFLQIYVAGQAFQKAEALKKNPTFQALSIHQHIYLLLSSHNTDTIKTGLANHSNLQFANKPCIQNEEGNILLKVQQIRITKTETLRHRLMITDDSLKNTADL